MTATPDNDGWIEHDGSQMPMAGDVLVLVKFRDGSPYYCVKGSERSASAWLGDGPPHSNWHWSEGSTESSDIIAYRVIPHD